MTIRMSEIPKETTLQKELRMKRINDDLCIKFNLLNEDEMKALTQDDKIKLLNNTIKKISKYYNENDSSKLCTSQINQFRVYELIEAEKGEFIDRDKKYEIRNYKKFVKNMMVNTYMSEVDTKENYYPSIYKYAVKFFNFRLNYVRNRTVIDSLVTAKKLDIDKQLDEHFSPTLNKIIDFHTKVQEHQLNQYFNYYYDEDIPTKKTKKLKELIEARYNIFFLLFRKRIKNISVDTTLSNPYEFI